ncbi:MAG: AAA family ATPase [Anaerolineales bacterium]|nr:AAA family ATPase [Anaerolineales bacterium]
MNSTIADLFQGRGQILTLIGKAGLGKSRLIEELHTELNQDFSSDYRWINTRGLSYEMARPYSIFVQALRQVCQVNDEDPVEILHDKVQESFASLSIEQQSGITNTLEVLLSVEKGSEYDVSPVNGEAIKREFFPVCWIFGPRRQVSSP